MNVRNNFQAIGRLTADPKVFDNADGSKKVRFTVAVKDNYQSKDPEGKMGYNSQFLPVEVFLSADRVAKSGLGVYANVHQGDLVAITGQVENNNFTDKTGAERYELVLHIETCDLMEPRSVTDARAVNRAVAASDAQDAAPQA